jgi:hypothetical protein
MGPRFLQITENDGLIKESEQIYYGVLHNIDLIIF